MRDELVGTWRLVSVRTIGASRKRNDAPYGAKPSGFIIYTAEGRMSATIGFDGRPPLSANDWRLAPAEERAEAFKTFLAYAGSYSVMEDRVIHHVEVSSVQNWVNTDLLRMVRFAGDTIILTTPPAGEEALAYELTWQRLAPASS